jgi:flagellar basal-body rod protein FlgC
MGLVTALAIAGSGMAAESERLSAVASNLANSNSIATSSGAAYRAREVIFKAVSAAEDADQPSAVGMAGVRVVAVVESAAPPRTLYEPGSTFADANGYVTMPNVNAVEEMVNMISAQQDYQANLEAFNVAKSLALRTLAI